MYKTFIITHYLYIVVYWYVVALFVVVAIVVTADYVFLLHNGTEYNNNY